MKLPVNCLAPHAALACAPQVGTALAVRLPIYISGVAENETFGFPGVTLHNVSRSHGSGFRRGCEEGGGGAWHAPAHCLRLGVFFELQPSHMVHAHVYPNTPAMNLP